MSTGRVARKLALANMGLTLFAIVVIFGSYLFHVRGGLDNRPIDRLQAWTLWAYLLLTPLLVLATFFADQERPRSKGAYWPGVVWLVSLVAGTFIHF